MAINYTQTRLTHLAFEDVGNSKAITTLRVPRITQAQIDKGSSLFENGDIAYNTNTNKIMFYENGNWTDGAVAGGNVISNDDIALDSLIASSGGKIIKTSGLSSADVVVKSANFTTGNIVLAANPSRNVTTAASIPLSQVAKFKSGPDAEKGDAAANAGTFYHPTDEGEENHLLFSTGAAWATITTT